LLFCSFDIVSDFVFQYSDFLNRMWELISANKRNSIILMTAMAICLLVLGAVIGSALGDPFIGLIIAAAVWLVMSIISYFGGDKVLLSASGAQPVTKAVHPQLFNVVEEMTIASGIGTMPAIYIINDPAPNAFATGRDPKTASIAVTAGLLGRLNRDELQGVVAHEMSHIINRDILYVTVAGVMLGAIVLISEGFLRGMFYSNSMSRRTSSRDNNQGRALMLVVALIFAILAPLFAQLLYFALSRSREYMADAGGARLTRYPEGLASALEKISRTSSQLATANKATAPMYIVNPFMQATGSTMSLFATHPPIEKRIAILRGMMHGANWKDYTEAYAAVTHDKLKVPDSAVKADQAVPLRGPSSEAQGPVETEKTQQRQTADIMRAVSGFSFVTCQCGLKMKVPPQLAGQGIRCPRCGSPVQ
jgi:heat shock protein HtpX